MLSLTPKYYYHAKYLLPLEYLQPIGYIFILVSISNGHRTTVKYIFVQSIIHYLYNYFSLKLRQSRLTIAP